MNTIHLRLLFADSDRMHEYIRAKENGIHISISIHAVVITMVLVSVVPSAICLHKNFEICIYMNRLNV